MGEDVEGREKEEERKRLEGGEVKSKEGGKEREETRRASEIAELKGKKKLRSTHTYLFALSLLVV